MHDVIIVGGGTAGLSAALVLGRSRRQVLICDNGAPRNAVSPAMHSFLSRDGQNPLDFLRIGREQLQPYTSISVSSQSVTQIERNGNTFTVTLQDDTRHQAKRIILATGKRDILPSIPGFAELWGTAVFHCPYCHGWEVRDQPLAVYADGETGYGMAVLLTGWSRNIVLCTGGEARLDNPQRQHLERLSIEVREKPIARLEGGEGHLTIVFDDGMTLERHAMMVRPAQEQRSDLAFRLGCRLTDIGTVETDENRQTTIAGVYAVGDMAQARMQQAIVAATDGLIAATHINNTLIFTETNALGTDDKK